MCILSTTSLRRVCAKPACVLYTRGMICVLCLRAWLSKFRTARDKFRSYGPLCVGAGIFELLQSTKYIFRDFIVHFLLKNFELLYVKDNLIAFELQLI